MGSGPDIGQSPAEGGEIPSVYTPGPQPLWAFPLAGYLTHACCFNPLTGP